MGKGGSLTPGPIPHPEDVEVRTQTFGWASSFFTERIQCVVAERHSL